MEGLVKSSLRMHKDLRCSDAEMTSGVELQGSGCMDVFSVVHRRDGSLKGDSSLWGRVSVGLSVM